MKKRNYILLNLIFILITVISLILSLVFQFFFFIPIICFLPFTCTFFRDQEQEAAQEMHFDAPHKAPDYCQECGGKIEQKDAIHCYHCGAKLFQRKNGRPK